VLVEEPIVHATAAGRKARAVWHPLCGEIEDRWVQQFGTAQIERLRTSLSAVVAELSPALPDCLPILGYGLVTRLPKRVDGPLPEHESAAAGDRRLPVLLAKALVALA